MELHERIANSPVGPALKATNGDGTAPVAFATNRLVVAVPTDSTIATLKKTLFDSTPVAIYDSHHNLNVKHPETRAKSKYLN